MAVWWGQSCAKSSPAWTEEAASAGRSWRSRRCTVCCQSCCRRCTAPVTPRRARRGPLGDPPTCGDQARLLPGPSRVGVSSYKIRLLARDSCWCKLSEIESRVPHPPKPRQTTLCATPTQTIGGHRFSGSAQNGKNECNRTAAVLELLPGALTAFVPPVRASPAQAGHQLRPGPAPLRLALTLQELRLRRLLHDVDAVVLSQGGLQVSTFGGLGTLAGTFCTFTLTVYK